MKKLLSKFKVLVPALVCLLALTMVLFTGCKEDVPAHTHTMTHVEGTAATCTTTGVKEHYHCSTCEKDFLTKEGTEEVSAESLVIAIDENNHNYNLSETEFAFAKNEQGEWTCVATTKCSRNAEHNKLVAHATKVEEEKVTEATCENGGSYTLKATFENTLYGTNGVVTKENITTTALGHNYGELVDEVPATCTADGTKEHYTCSVCHKNFDKNHKEIKNLTLPAKHNLSRHAQQDPTCTATGNIEYWSCSACGKNFSDPQGTREVENVTIDKIAHKYTNADGQTNYVYDYENARYVASCTRCNHQDATQTQPAGTEQNPYLANDEATFAAVITKGGYVKLENDITITTGYTISKETHLDLNGKTLKSTADLLRYTNGSNNSTIVGNRADSSQKGYLKIECDKNDVSNKNRKIFSVFDNYDQTKLTITNVDMTSPVWGISLFENSSITLDNCTLIAEKSNAISTNNLWSASSENGMNVVIRNSTIISRGDAAIFIPGYMNLTVENSSITGYTSAIHALMGNINVDATSTLHATKNDFSLRNSTTVKESGAGEAEWDGAAILIRTNYYYNHTDVNEAGTAITSTRYAVGNKLTLNIADWSKVTATSGVKAAVYNWTEKSSYIAEAESAGLTITDQFVEATQKLADKDGVKFYEYNGTEVKEMSVYTYSYVQEANTEAGTPAKTYLTKIIATTKEVDMGGTSGSETSGSGTSEGATPEGSTPTAMPKAYVFYSVDYENGTLSKTATGMYSVMDKDGRVIYASVNDDKETMPLTFKVNQGNILSLALYIDGNEDEGYVLFDDGKFGIATPSAEGYTFAEYDCTISENTVTVTISEGTTRTFTIDKEKNTITEVK